MDTVETVVLANTEWDFAFAPKAFSIPIGIVIFAILRIMQMALVGPTVVREQNAVRKSNIGTMMRQFAGATRISSRTKDPTALLAFVRLPSKLASSAMNGNADTFGFSQVRF